MDHTAIPDPPGYADLSTEEQVRYIQALWDRVFEHPDDLPVPESHLEILEERMAERQSNPPPTRSAYEALDELTKRFR